MTSRPGMPIAAFLLLGAACAAPAGAAGIHVRMEPVSALVQSGDTVTVSITISPADESFNAFDLVTTYDPARLTFLSVSPISKQVGSLVTGSCATLFHLFSADPPSGILTANLSLLCNNIFLSGPGVIYVLKFRAEGMQGSTTVTLDTGTQFYRAGLFVDPHDVTPLTVSVGAVGVGEPSAAAARAAGVRLRAPAPSPRRGGAGTVSVPVTLARPAVVRMALLDTAGRLVIAREGQALPAGDHGVQWTLPRLAPGVYVLWATTGEGDRASALWAVAP